MLSSRKIFVKNAQRMKFCNASVNNKGAEAADSFGAPKHRVP
jgi:hypothetical protein